MESFELSNFHYSSLLFSGFDMVMLSGVRAFVEQQPAADDYTKFK